MHWSIKMLSSVWCQLQPFPRWTIIPLFPTSFRLIDILAMVIYKPCPRVLKEMLKYTSIKTLPWLTYITISFIVLEKRMLFNKPFCYHAALLQGRFGLICHQHGSKSTNNIFSITICQNRIAEILLCTSPEPWNWEGSGKWDFLNIVCMCECVCVCVCVWVREREREGKGELWYLIRQWHRLIYLFYP